MFLQNRVNVFNHGVHPLEMTCCEIHEKISGLRMIKDEMFVTTIL